MQTRSNLILRDLTERIPQRTKVCVPHTHSYGLRSTHCKLRPSCVAQAEPPKCGMNKPVDDDALYPIIDFDEASRCWKKNKVSKGNGTYAYRKR